MVRRLQVDGAQLDGIHYIRALGNADTLRRDVDDVERVVCVGGSYIGSEVAATLTELGKRVTVVMQEAHPLERQFGTRAGERFRGSSRRTASRSSARTRSSASRRRRRASATRARRARRQKGGRTLRPARSSAASARMPDVMLARRAGLDAGRARRRAGDSRLRTSAEGVFAAGDICEYDSVVHGRVMRIEHEEVAAAQGATAARNMLGADAPHDVVPYFFSDLADWAAIEYVGPALAWDEEVVRGDIDAGAFAVWYLEGGRVRGMLSVDGGRRRRRGRADLAPATR